MAPYSLVPPHEYSEQHTLFINQVTQGIQLLSQTSHVIMGLKDINSRHIIATDKYARTIGLLKGNDVNGMLDKDLPCQAISDYAETFIAQDQDLLSNSNLETTLTALNIHNYSDGVKSRIIKKNMLIHHESKSILGILYQGYDIELSDVLNILPACFIKTNTDSTVLAHQYQKEINLTDYEQEICFLLLQNWDMKNIADFMNQTRPLKVPRVADTIVKRKNYICHKLGLNSTLIESLKCYLGVC
jgi:hypothetical protein